MDYQIAKITSTMLGNEDHGIMTCYLYLDLEDSGGIGYGGYGMDKPVKYPDGQFIRREGAAFGMECIRLILETLGVGRWEDLPGTFCRLRPPVTLGETSSKCEIGNALKDKWFSFEKTAARFKEDG